MKPKRKAVTWRVSCSPTGVWLQLTHRDRLILVGSWGGSTRALARMVRAALRQLAPDAEEKR